MTPILAVRDLEKTFGNVVAARDNAPLSGPSPEAKRYLEDLPIDYMSGSRGKHSGQSFVEHFTVGSDGKIRDMQYQLASHELPERRRKAQPDTSSGESTWGWRSPERTVERGGHGAWVLKLTQLSNFRRTKRLAIHLFEFSGLADVTSLA